MSNARQNADSIYTKVDNTGDTMTGSLEIVADANNGTLETLLRLSRPDDAVSFEIAKGTNEGANGFTLGTETGHDLILQTGDTEGMRIDSSGRVGIGETDPQRVLHITDPTTAFIRLEDSGGSLGAACQAMVEMYAGSSRQGELGFSTGAGNMSLSNNQGNVFIQADVNNAAGSSAIVFTVDNSESARFTSDKLFIAGRSTQITSLSGHVLASPDGSRRACDMYIGTSSGATDAFRVYSDVGGSETNVAAIEANGDFLSATNSYGALSDVRLKDNIVDANSQWEDIKNLRVCNFNMKATPDARQLGVIAQEVEQVSPGLVQEGADGYKTVGYSILYMKAVKALQEAIARIEELEHKVQTLEEN